MIVIFFIAPQNGFSVRVRFDLDLASATSLLAVNLALPIWKLFVGLRIVRLTGTAVQCLVRNRYGFTVHRPSNRVSKEPTETNGDRDGRIRGYGLGRVKKTLKQLCWRSEVSRWRCRHCGPGLRLQTHQESIVISYS